MRCRYRAETPNIRRKYALEVSIQAKFHAVYLRKTFGGTPVRGMQVPFKLVFKSDRANDDVQLMTKFQGLAKHAREKQSEVKRQACVTRDREPGLLTLTRILISSIELSS